MLLSMNAVCGDVARGALALAHEHPLASQLLLRRLARIEPAQGVELGRRREVDDVLHLRHHRDLVDAVGQVDALALRADVVAVEVGGALLELGEVLHRAQRPLRAVDLLVEQAAQADGIQPEAGRLRADVRRLVEGRVGVEIRSGNPGKSRRGSGLRPCDPRSD